MKNLYLFFIIKRLYRFHYDCDLVIRRENISGKGARLSHRWLLGLRATPAWTILTRTNEQ